MNEPSNRLCFDELEFTPADGLLARRDQGASVQLRPQAATLLNCLLQQPEQVVGRETLHKAIWGEHAVVDFDAGLSALLRELRQALSELGVDSALIETLPRRGYRLNARILETAPAASPARSDKRYRQRWILVAALLVAILAAIFWWSRPPEHLDAAPYSLAILPPTVFGLAQPEARALPILLADHLLAELWRAGLQDLDLIGRTGMQAYLDRDDVAGAVARDLGVNLLIEGSIVVEDSGWKVEFRLLQMPRARIIWSHSISGAETRLPLVETASTTIATLAEDWPEIRNNLPDHPDS